MSGSAVIDSLEFARTGQELHGSVPLARLLRLADSLYDHAGDLEFRVCGRVDAKSRPVLHLEVRGALNLRCQRCLRALRYPLELASDLLVLVRKRSEPEQEAALDELDGVPADPHTDVWALVEDEVLIALPIAPKHLEGGCSPVPGEAGSETTSASPFAALAVLKKN